MKLLGILLIINALAITGWHAANTTGNKTVIVVCLIAVFAGIVLTFQDRITELTIKGVGSLKAATKEAESKLEEIEAIRKRVEAQGATIDLVAKDASEARSLTEEIKLRSEQVEKKMTEVDGALARAEEKATELASILEFTNTVVAAQNDDRTAFDKLKGWAETPSFPYKEAALQAYTKIMDDHSQGMYNSGFTIPWRDGFDPSLLDLNALRSQYASAPRQLKPAFLEYIWNRVDFAKRDKMDFLMDVMLTDRSLTAVEYAGRHFTQGADLKIKPVAVDYLRKWWSENRDNFKE